MFALTLNSLGLNIHQRADSSRGQKFLVTSLKDLINCKYCNCQISSVFMLYVHCFYRLMCLEVHKS